MALSQKLFLHVATVLKDVRAITEVIVLSHERPPAWTGPLMIDAGTGLNAELRSLAQKLIYRPLLITLADLPFVSTQDVSLMLAEADGGIAIAPDRHGTGTNAIALNNAHNFRFSFGLRSFELHLAAASCNARYIKRFGLGLDIDTPEDLEMATSLGFLLE